MGVNTRQPRVLRGWGKVRVLVSLAVVGMVLFFAPTLPQPLLEPHRALSLRILDRNGVVLRDVLSTQAGVAHWRALSEISPYLINATIVSEDQRFFSHWGIDSVAVVRAARENWRHNRVVQGGSTLTQQTVRTLLDQQTRDFKAKIQEAYWALRLDRHYSKEQLLEIYLNRISYGSQCYGVEAAAQFYFAKPAGQLSCAQAAFLAILPRAPESFRPYQDPEEIQVLQKQLLRRMHEAGKINAEQLELALSEPILLHAGPSFFEAGHFCDYVLKTQPAKADQGVLQTTLDSGLNREVQAILKTHVGRLRNHGVGNGAVVILDVFTGDILAMVGSTDYEGSQFNAATAGRQPGSALKPFTYALAMEHGKTAASLLPDLDLYPRQVANGYIPRNYDNKFHGPVRLRTALACSYNVPVVRVLEELGAEVLLTRLRNLGFERLTDTPQHYGLGLTLGDGEVTLLELANAYRVLARSGRFQPTRSTMGGAETSATPVIDRRAAYLITDILKDRLERVPAFGRSSPLNLPFDCAAKTGTSKSYRDNWTVGYTPRYVVAVWVGNFDGSSMRDVSGITGAGPIFRDCFLELEKRDGGSPAFTVPEGIEEVAICPVSGELPGPNCPSSIHDRFLSERKPTSTCGVHQRFLVDAAGRPSGAPLPGTQGGRVFLVYPPIFRNWMASEGMPLPPVGGLSEKDSTPVRVAFPDSESVFRRDPVVRADYQEIHFRAVVPGETARVEWRIDDTLQKSSAAPFDVWWKLTPGRHRASLTAFDARGRGLGESAAITFSVR